MGHRAHRRAASSVAAVAMAVACAGSVVVPASALADRGHHGPSGQPPTGGGPSVGDASARADALVAQMTLDEKLSLVEGTSEPAATNEYQAGYLPGIPRLGIPALRLADGPPGTATRRESVGMTQTMGVAATFSDEDAQQNGVVIGRDARALGIDVTLQPFVNLYRDPTWSRAFNTFGEDPLLTGHMGAQEIQGIQSQGTMAQVKHYIAYDGAGGNVTVDEQTLHEIYLQPFDDAVQAGVASVMCSYNKINTQYACGSATTLTQILRNELGFDGFVTSDWGATHGLTFINAGLDMEMPGATDAVGAITPYFTKAALTAAVQRGTVSEDRIDEAVARILGQEIRFGLLDGQSKHNVTPEPVDADLAVVQETAQDAATLLKNTGGALPLDRSDLGSLVLIGPGAGQTMATNGGGERSGGIAARQIGTLQALRQAAGGRGAHIDYAVADDMTGVPVPASALSHDGSPGLARDGGGSDPQVNFTSAGHNALAAGSSVTWNGTLTAPQSGAYWLNIQSLGAAASLTVDGTDVTKTSNGFGGLTPRFGTVHATDIGPLPTTDGLANGRAKVTLSAGAHTIKIVTQADVSGAPVQVRLSWQTPAQQVANHDAAVDAARQAGTAVVFAWSDGDLSDPLPNGQDQLIADVAAVNPNTIVVLNNNNPVAMPWRDAVRAVLDMWFPGDSGGTATANILLGKANPAGRLPFTWPVTVGQGVANQPGAHPERTSAGLGADGQLCTDQGSGPGAAPACTTTYSEGLDIGYRWYDSQGVTPLYPFGYGLSYSTFAYDDVSVSAAQDGGLDVSFRLSNTGSVAGDEVPQVYLGAPDDPPAGVQFAVRALAGYQRVSLPAGASRTVSIHVAPRALQYWNTDGSGWTVAAGSRTVWVGGSSRDLPLQTSATITA